MQQNARRVSKGHGQFYAKTTDVNHKKKWEKGAISIELAPFSH